jgi:F-type H+-transporting ATPase subunit b
MQIDWWTLGIQTVNFLVVVWLLSRLLYRPVRRMIEQREAADRKLSEEAREKADDAEAVRKEYERKTAELAAVQRHRESELQNEMKNERDTVLKEAKAAADALISQTRERLEREREETLSGLKAEIAALAVDLARRALASNGSEGAVLSQLTKHLDHLPPQELAELKTDVARPDARLTVVTAAPLDEEIQGGWRSALSERLGSDVAVEFASDPEIIGGTELRFPHASLNLSVAQRLRSAAEELKA